MSEVGSSAPKTRLERSDFESIVVECDEDTRRQFLDLFTDEIDGVVDGLMEAYAAIHDSTPSLQDDLRAAWIEGFLYSALDCIATSTKLLLMGMAIPAGNLMRQFGEACAMALLCSHQDLDVVQRLQSEHGYPTHKAIDAITTKKNRDVLDVDAEGWETFTEITKWYSRFSHASRMGVAANLLFGDEGGYLIGGGFDEEKTEEYRKELRLRGSACQVLADMAGRVIRMASRAQEAGLLQEDST